MNLKIGKDLCKSNMFSEKPGSRNDKGIKQSSYAVLHSALLLSAECFALSQPEGNADVSGVELHNSKQKWSEYLNYKAKKLNFDSSLLIHNFHTVMRLLSAPPDAP